MDIYIIKTSEAEHIPESLLKDFQKKNISDKKKWQEHCFTYLMLDRILAYVYNVKNTDIEFINNKPTLTNNEKCFSLSHSREYIAIAISDYKCGIDIEKNKERDYQNIAKRMNFKCNSLQSFYNNWTLYEAKYKLSDIIKSTGSFIIEDYTISAVSSNKNEKFEIYIQN